MPLTAPETPAIGPPAPAQPGGSTYLRRRGPALCLCVLSLLYFIPTCIRAAHLKLWFDEIFTFHAATLLPSLGALWVALKQVDYSPPLGYILAFASESVFGKNEFGLRFPSIIGFWIMALCLYVFLRRRLPWTYATVGMLFTALTAAERYSYEARPPALVLAMAGIALVAWQTAAEGRKRAIALVSLSAALIAALCSHALAVTLAVPLVAGELTRTIQRKRVDWPVWAAFAASTPALLVLWQLKTTGNPTAYWKFGGSLAGHILTSYQQILRPAFAPLALALLVALVLRTQKTAPIPRSPGLRPYELAALLGFALIPFVAVPISTMAGRYFLRYSLNCTIGLAGLLAALLFWIGRKNHLAGATVLMVFGAAFAIGQFLPEDRRPDAGLKSVNASEEIQPFLERMPSDAPIVICRGTTFVELEHYSSPPLAARLYYLTEPSVSAAIDGDILFEVKEPLIAKYFDFRSHFEDYHSFIAKHKRFYVVEPIRNIAREYFAGRLNLQPRVDGHFVYYEATTR